MANVVDNNTNNSLTKGNVILVDPNTININENIVNGIPQYQEMFIFAELIAESKGRTILEIGGNATSTQTQKVNLIGNNQDNSNNNPNFLNFTTNYYDGSTGNRIQYEGFGITNIKITTNSSYVPQVYIQFVDVRGLSFFNQENSPYRILFDFPPPTFKLTVKGYYGKPITYILHLVKYTSEFQSETGNFVIDANFVAMTFAPLSDILFRYVVNFPLIEDIYSSDPDTSKPPENTNDLILKLKKLYSGVSEKFKNSVEVKKHDAIIKQIEKINDLILMLNEFRNQEELQKIGTPYIIIKSVKEKNYVENNPATQTNIDAIINPLKNVSDFDNYIIEQSSSGRPATLKDRLCIVYVVTINTNDNNDNNLIYTGDTGNINTIKSVLNTYKSTLLKNSELLNIQHNDIKNPSTFFGNYCITPVENQNIPTQYVELDITDYYYKLYNKLSDLNNSKFDIETDISATINNMVTERLGMIPSIYNIFKIILDDVDKFFNILRKTSSDAQKLHNTKEEKNKIAGNNSSDVKGITIYPFPLIIEDRSFHGGSKEERVAPIKLSKSAKFPELELIQNFIDTFKYQSELQNIYDLRNQQNDDGSFKWIPISPYDSILADTSPASPYYGINGDILNEMFKILLKRFYMLSQGIITNNFYNTGDVHDAYVKLFANAEAVNLATSLEPNNINLLKTQIEKFKTPDDFYNYILNNKAKFTDINDGDLINLYDFKKDTVKYFSITPNDNSDGVIYTDKNNSDFRGLNIYKNEIILQEISENESSDKLINIFNNEARANWFTRIFKGNPSEYTYKFTNENVLYIQDVNDTDARNINGVSLSTRFLCGNNQRYNKDENTRELFPSIPNVIAYGNKAFNVSYGRDLNNLKHFNDIINVWTYIFTFWDDNIITTINQNNDYLNSLLYLSNFGYTLSPFNKYPNNLNNIIFNAPAVIEVPTFISAYIGSLLHSIKNGWKDEIINFFTGSTAKLLPNQGFFILADLHDVDKYLSENDKDLFIAEYELFMSEQYSLINNAVINMYNELNNNLGENKKFKNKNTGYEFLLNPNSTFELGSGKGSYWEIIDNLIIRTNIINYSQLTFNMQDNSYNEGYSSLYELNKDDIYKNVNDSFFTIFFNKLKNEINETIKNNKIDEEEQKKLKGDEDIITQTYYSFKNINDKWLTGNNSNGYPFNVSGKNLIDSFAFVDRAMNPIGDTILNAEILCDIFDDPNISVFTALSQLLSINGFEFFPIQHFLNIDNNEWENTFKIHTEINSNDPSVSFICMYVGGSSSYPSISTNGFENDGIIDLLNPTVKDFSSKKPADDLGTVNDTQEKNNKNFPWRQVRAFRVKFGEQNQSMFTNIKIDSKEYPETNESIQILSRLAGDNKAQAPPPKGQNLYSLYENRSYKATVSGLGNAMIQPTQYFQLENVPLFNGAYIILNVEHNIVPNKMTTTFSGTKLLKYPIPRVTNPIAFTGFDDEFASKSAGDIIKGVLLDDDFRVKYNALYKLKIE